MSRYLFILLLVGIWASSKAQTGQECNFTLSGSVIDEHDQSPLSFATVYILESEQGVVADENGKYLLEDLCKGEYSIVVSHVSCEPDTLSIQVNRSQKRTLLLEHHAEALSEVTVVGENLEQQTTSDQVNTLGLSSIERYTGASLGDALRLIPGVSSLKTGNTVVKPVVQGLFGSRIITVNHGVRMQDMEWGDEHASTIDINTAGKITLVNGGSALRYGGDAVGGLIIVEPLVIPHDTLIGRTILHGATNGRGGSISSEITKSGKRGWFGKVQAALKRFGDFTAPDYQLTNTGFFEKGVSISAGHKGDKRSFDLYYSIFDTEIAILSASHIGSISDLVDAIESGDPQIIEDFSYTIGLPRQEVTHQLLRAQFNRKLGIGQLHLQYDFQHNHRFEFDKRVGDDRNEPSIDLELATHTFSGNLSFNEAGSLPLEAGVIYRYQNNFANPETGIKRLIPDYDKYEAGAFLSGKYHLTNRLLLDAGLRYDYSKIDALKFYRKSRWEEREYQQDFADIIIKEFPTQLLTNPKFDYHNLSYAVGLNYQLSDQTEIRFNYSFVQRAPNPSELFSDGLHHGAARIELGDLRIQQERGHKFGLSANGLQGIWSWSLSPYLNFMNNFVFLDPVGVEQTIRGAFPVWEYKKTDAHIFGADGQAMAQWSPQWSTNHNFRYVYGHNTGDDEPLNYIPAPQIENALTYEHRSWNKLQITLESQYTFEQNRYPDQNFLVYIPESDSFEEVDISTPPDGYHLLNFRTNMQFKLFGNQYMDLGIQINNIFNTRYRDYLNRLRYFADELGRSFEATVKFNY
jgi:iron complex outermembrane receptor protein